jgi:hypothetical protein
MYHPGMARVTDDPRAHVKSRLFQMTAHLDRLGPKLEEIKAVFASEGREDMARLCEELIELAIVLRDGIEALRVTF